MARTFPEIIRTYTWRDSALYALGLGIGADPMAPDELRYVYEDAIPVSGSASRTPESIFAKWCMANKR
jgi:hypothetical protein